MVILSGNISYAQDKKTQTVLLFGDSIIAGYGLVEKNSLTVKLQEYFDNEKMDVKVINGGVSGDTTSGGRSRLAWTLKKYNPDVVFIALGGNDLLRGFSPSVTRDNIDAMLATAKETNTKVILSAVQSPSNLGLAYSRQFNSIYPELAKKYKVPLYPFLLEKTFGKTNFMQQDSIHPSEEGIKEIAKELAPYLKKALK